MNEKKVQLSNVELLLALISERTKEGDPLKRSDIPKILGGDIAPKTEYFNKVKFGYVGYADASEEDVLFDISTLIGIGSVNQKRKDNPGEIIYIATESGEMDLEKLMNVLKNYKPVELAINSFQPRTSILE